MRRLITYGVAFSASLFITVNLNGCFMRQWTAPQPVDRYPPGLPLHPASYGGDLTAVQTVTLRYPLSDPDLLSSYQNQSVVQINNDQLTLIGLGPMNARLFTIHWDGQEVTAETRVETSDHISPADILVDFQLGSWPIAPLQDAINQSNWSSNLPSNWQLQTDGSTRLVYFQQRLIYRIEYPQPGHIRLTNLLHDYEITSVAQRTE